MTQPTNTLTQPAGEQAQAAHLKDLPDFPLVINVKTDARGRVIEQVFTVRGFSLEKLARNYETTFTAFGLSREDGGEESEQEEEAPYCAKHKTTMERHSKGGQVWYSHKTKNGEWCRGK